MLLPPRVTLNLGLLIAAILTLAFIAIVLTPPYTGFAMEWDDNTQSMRVVRADQWIVDQGLAPRDRIVSAKNDRDVQVRFGPMHILKSGTHSRQFFETPDQRIANVDLMYRLFAAEHLEITTQTGDVVSLTLDRERPLSSLPAASWFTFAIALTAPLIGLWVWAWNQHKPEARLLLFGGIAFFMAALHSAASIYVIEMFFFPAAVYWGIRVLMDLGQIWYAGLGASVLLFFPARVKYARQILTTLLVGALLYTPFCYLNDWENRPDFRFYQFQQNDLESYSPLIFFFLATIALCITQWQISKREPLLRAQVKWVILAWTLGPFVYLMLYVLPRFLEQPPIIDSGLSIFFVILSSYLLILVGVARLDLFQLEQHIGLAYQWSVATLLFIGLDIALVSIANLSATVSTTILVVAILWLYVPARQWALHRLNERKHARREQIMIEAIVTMVRKSLISSESARSTWNEVLRSLFSPAKLSYPDVDLQSTTEITNRGQGLVVRANRNSPAIAMEYAEGGARLFHADDVEIVEMLCMLFERLHELRDAYITGQTEERNRIRRDLHDQIGHNLLSLVYGAGAENASTIAQETMNQLSTVIQAMKQEPVHLEDLCTRIRMLCEESCNSAGIELTWLNKAQDDSPDLVSSDKYAHMVNIVRELLNNTIRHSGATRVQLEIRQEADELLIRFSDNGRGFEPALESGKGNGLSNIRWRGEELGATMTWSIENGADFELRVPDFQHA